jgi:hypothetical protein
VYHSTLGLRVIKKKKKFAGKVRSVDCRVYSGFIQVSGIVRILLLIDRLRVSGRGSTRAEDAQGKPSQSHISPSIL